MGPAVDPICVYLDEYLPGKEEQKLCPTTIVKRVKEYCNNYINDENVCIQKGINFITDVKLKLPELVKRNQEFVSEFSKNSTDCDAYDDQKLSCMLNILKNSTGRFEFIKRDTTCFHRLVNQLKESFEKCVGIYRMWLKMSLKNSKFSRYCKLV